MQSRAGIFLNLEVEMKKSNIVYEPARWQKEESHKWGSISLPKPIGDECEAHTTYCIDHKLKVSLLSYVEKKA